MPAVLLAGPSTPLTADLEILDAATRREFLAMVAAAGLVAACGDDGGEAASNPGGPSGLATWRLGPHGPVEVPRDPQRVVVGNSIDADFALVLGLPLVGVPGNLGLAARPYAEYHASRLAGVERVQTGGEPNLEQVLNLRPDLILDSWDVERPRFEAFNELAPTVNFTPVLYPEEFARTDWQGALRALGKLFDRDDEAEAAIADYDAAIAAGRTALADLRGRTFAGVNSFGLEGAGIIDQGQQISKVASDLGLVPHELVSDTPADRVVLSLEQLGRLEPVDVLLFARFPVEDSLERESAETGLILGSPLWTSLPAVREGRLAEYDSEMYYASPLTAVALVDALVAALAP
jgi:iron complex transport system substrate-binding protein